jgi:hypothetical protein
MARTKKSLFCADCKAMLAGEIVRAMKEGYKFEDVLRVFALFSDKSRPYLEGYLYAIWKLTKCEDALRTKQGASFEMDLNCSRAEKEGIEQGIADGMHVLRHEAKHDAWDSHVLRHRMYELVVFYFAKIRYTFPGYDPRMTETVVRHVWGFLFSRMNLPMPIEAPKSEEDEVDSICKAIESIAEKI